MNKSKKPTQMYISFFKKNPHLRIWLLILERKGGWGRKRNINRLPSIRVPTGTKPQPGYVP